MMTETIIVMNAMKCQRGDVTGKVDNDKNAKRTNKKTGHVKFWKHKYNQHK
jgi:hypothetical protein